MKPVDELVGYYKNALDELTLAIARVDLRSPKNLKATYKDISKVLQGLEENVSGWVTTTLRDVHKKGIEHTLKITDKRDLHYDSISKHQGLTSLFDSVEENTVADLHMVIQNIRKKLSSNMKRATSEMLVSNGENQPFIQRQLLDSLQFGMIDTAGRKWKPLTYAALVAETQMMNLYRDVMLNTALLLGIDYAVISSHGATDSCQPYEGKIVKLRRGAVGDYEVYNDVQYSGEIFHIHCKHVLIPISSPEDYPADISTKANSPSFQAKTMGLVKDY